MTLGSHHGRSSWIFCANAWGAPPPPCIQFSGQTLAQGCYLHRLNLAIRQRPLLDSCLPALSRLCSATCPPESSTSMAKAKFFVALTAAFVLSGCASFLDLFRPTHVRACDPNIQNSGSSLSLKGLQFTIPFQTPVPVKIGEFTYAPQVINAVSDTVQFLDVYKSAQCVALEAMLAARATAQEIAPLANKVADANTAISLAFYSLKNGKVDTPALKTAIQTVASDPQTAPALKQQAAVVQTSLDQAAQVQQTPAPSTPSAPRPAASQPRAEVSPAPGSSIPVNRPFVVGMPSQPLVVHGYRPGQYRLTASMAQRLETDFRNAELAAPEDLKPRIHVIGYADSPGSLRSNYEISALRATVVAEYLAKNLFVTRERIASVRSGGIANSGDARPGRRVDVWIDFPSSGEPRANFVVPVI